MNPPLKISKNHWRSRWLVVASWNKLHRVSEIDWDDDEEMIVGQGIAVCGVAGRMMMPGVMSRMGLDRCKHCCKGTGVPYGAGNPFNQGIDDEE